MGLWRIRECSVPGLFGRRLYIRNCPLEVRQLVCPESLLVQSLVKDMMELALACHSSGVQQASGPRHPCEWKGIFICALAVCDGKRFRGLFHLLQKDFLFNLI